MSGICIIDCGSSKVPDIAVMLEGAGARAAVIPLAAADAGADLVAFDGVVISGGPHLFTTPGTGPALAAQFGFIDQLTQPTLGICLGHQAIGLRHGVEVYLGPERRSDEVIRVVAEHPLLRGLGDSPVFAEDHCEGIPLPDGFDLLAASEAYAVEAMASRTRALYGVQFHPEVSGEPGRALLANFVEMVNRANAGGGR